MEYLPEALKLLVDFFYQDWHATKTPDERTAMLKNARVVRKISIWCTVLTQTMVTIYIVLRISMIVSFKGSNSARPLLYTAYFPFDVSQTPIFEVICVCQILSAYSATVSYTGSDSFISMLVLHTCGQFQNLRRKLENIANEPGEAKTSEEFNRELKRIVMRHEHLNWFVIYIYFIIMFYQTRTFRGETIRANARRANSQCVQWFCCNPSLIFKTKWINLVDPYED